MMKRVQKHIDSNVTAADEVLQQSEEVVAKMVTFVLHREILWYNYCNKYLIGGFYDRR